MRPFKHLRLLLCFNRYQSILVVSIFDEFLAIHAETIESANWVGANLSFFLFFLEFKYHKEEKTLYKITKCDFNVRLLLKYHTLQKNGMVWHILFLWYNNKLNGERE